MMKKKKVYIIGGISIVILIIATIIVNIDISKNILTLKNKKEVNVVNQTKKEEVLKDAVTLKEVDGEMYVDIDKKYSGIIGIGDQKKKYMLKVLPYMKDQNKKIGLYAITYYNPKTLTNESLGDFCTEVVKHSDYTYVTLINEDNHDEGITITPGGINSVFTKGKITQSYIVRDDNKVGMYNENIEGGIRWYIRS